MQKILLGTFAAAALTLAAGLAVAQTGSPGSGTSAQSGQERSQARVSPRSGNSSEQRDPRQSGAREAESQRRAQGSGEERSPVGRVKISIEATGANALTLGTIADLPTADL